MRDIRLGEETNFDLPGAIKRGKPHLAHPTAEFTLMIFRAVICCVV